MDIFEAIEERRSIRAFKPDPVPKEVLVKVMETAIKSPSWSNTQPWEFAIVGGKAMDELKEALNERAKLELPRNMEVPGPIFPELFLERRRQNGLRLFEALGFGRKDIDKRRAHSQKAVRFFDAPNGIITYMDKRLGPWSVFDHGMISLTIMLAAVAHGLGTCALAAVVSQPDVIRKVIPIPDDKVIVIGLAIGYPDWEDPANIFRSEREPVEKVVTWHGI